MPRHTKKVKAIFKGENGSCGYELDKEYTLEISNCNLIDQRNSIRVTTWGRQEVIYATILGFLNNWDNIRNI